MVDKVKAIELREQGLTYKEISEELDCSLVWCKQNLKEVSKNTKEKVLVKSLTTKGRRSMAVTNGEILKELRELYPNDFSKESKLIEEKAMKRIKDQMSKDEQSLVRPYWMPPHDAHLCIKRIIQTVNEIDERVYEAVNDIREEFGYDESYINSLSFVINRLTFAGSAISQEPVQNFLERMEKIADELEKRNKVGTVPKSLGGKIPKPKEPMDFSDIESFIY